MTTTFYVTTAIPYVNAAPHLGHALELVQADVLARHHRLRGHAVRFLTGTDDNALKNVTAAAALGVDPRDFVAANADRFAGLREVLDLSFDDFISTSSDPRHRPGVERLWRASARRGDFYRRTYTGLYCAGCEQFYDRAELVDGACPEHGTTPQVVTESNWFFRLSRYAGEVAQALESGAVHIEPASRRNEVLAFVHSGLRDISVSRPAARAAGWGIPVPGDAEQVVYVWWDALANYITALGYAVDDPDHRRWWWESDERVHVIGKGIVRFHAVYWLALLLSAGQPLPTRILVHGYLTVAGAKLSKSGGGAVGPAELTAAYGVDAVRWWLLREVARGGDTDVETARLAARYHQDLANGLGNLVNRTVSLVHRYRGGVVPGGGRILGDRATVESTVDDKVAAFDFRGALDAIWSIVDDSNRYVETERPWALAGDPAQAGRLDEVLATLVHTSRWLAAQLSPFIPTGAARLLDQLGDATAVAPPVPVFPRLG